MKDTLSISHNPPVGWRQLELFSLSGKHLKPQITSTPGTSPKVRNRYRVTLGREILGDELTLEKALRLAKGEAK